MNVLAALGQTDLEPSMAWAAGQLVSTPADLVTFYRKLPTLLPAVQFTQMRQTVATDKPNERYGLGLVSTGLGCGGVYWGHSGGIHGYATLAGATDDGRAVGYAQTAMPGTYGDMETAVKRAKDVIDQQFC